uniref:Uncharacterized protein n=1 Tax=Rhizophora mucronata TaxID=61149 RepID=A0A2P2JDW6_RHIMU
MEDLHYLVLKNKKKIKAKITITEAYASAHQTNWRVDRCTPLPNCSPKISFDEKTHLTSGQFCI